MIVTEKAPAKLNLSLDTPMRYFDGSPQWDMVMVSADLADYVTVETHRRPATIKVYTNSGFLPNDQRNLAYQAAHILRSRFIVKMVLRFGLRSKSRLRPDWVVALQMQRQFYAH